MRLIVTRPRAETERLGGLLAGLGHGVEACPLMSIRFHDDVAVPGKDYAAVLITSANGARGVGHWLARKGADAPLAGALAVTVGPASEAAAGAAGFKRIARAAGDVAALIDWVIENLKPAAGPLLYASGAVTTGALCETLTGCGYLLDRVVFYEAVARPALPGAIRAGLAADSFDGVLLYSPRTARIWADLTARAGLTARAKNLQYFCLSANVAQAVARTISPASPARVCTTPGEAAMIKCVQAAPGCRS